MEYATRETQLRETTFRALDSLWTEVKILREWRASVEGRLESLESSSRPQEATASRNGLVHHSPSKEAPAFSPATDRGQHQASSTESSPPSSLTLSVLPPNSTGILILSHIRLILCLRTLSFFPHQVLQQCSRAFLPGSAFSSLARLSHLQAQRSFK